MLAAGIKTPVPLDELENHLREEVARLTKAGVSDSAAFAVAVRKMGQLESLRAEFQKATGLREFLAKPRYLTFGLSLTRILGFLWLGWSAPCLVQLCSEWPARLHFDPKSWFVFLSVLGCVVGGILLMADSRWGRTLVRINALFWTIMPPTMYILINHFAEPDIGGHSSHISFGEVISSPAGFFLALGLVSIFILHLPERANLKAMVRI